MAELIDRDALLKDLRSECPESDVCLSYIPCIECIVNRQSAVNRWIPCSERLPEDNCYTLVAVLFDEIYEVYIAAFRGDGWHTVEGYVTHWMPMPEPPEGGVEYG